MACRSQQNHIICKKQRCNPEVPKPGALLSPTTPPDAVHENHKQDRWPGVAPIIFQLKLEVKKSKSVLNWIEIPRWGNGVQRVKFWETAAHDTVVITLMATPFCSIVGFSYGCPLQPEETHQQQDSLLPSPLCINAAFTGRKLNVGQSWQSTEWKEPQVWTAPRQGSWWMALLTDFNTFVWVRTCQTEHADGCVKFLKLLCYGIQ